VYDDLVSDTVTISWAAYRATPPLLGRKLTNEHISLTRVFKRHTVDPDACADVRLEADELSWGYERWEANRLAILAGCLAIAVSDIQPNNRVHLKSSLF
jgi:hypothetical protein